MTTASDIDALKLQAALKAVEFIQSGMVVGLGTGSTSEHMIAALGRKVREGMAIRGVPTSQQTERLARQQGIPLLEADDAWSIDLALDGADQVDPRLNVIKGGGGALLKEKIVAAAARQFIVMVDYSKCVPTLGKTFPLPIEVIPFGWRTTARHVEVLTGAKITLRERQGRVFTTESGHYILDVHIGSIEQPAELETGLDRIPGIVETGLFVGRTSLLIVGTPEGVRLTSSTS